MSLGVAAMEIFGSYMGKDHSLAGEGARICGLDTFVAIMSGLIIFPACFSYGVEVDAGSERSLSRCQMCLSIWLVGGSGDVCFSFS